MNWLKALWFAIIIGIIAFPLPKGEAGTDSLPNIASSPTLVPATSAQYNAVVDAFQGHQVMRNESGTVTDNTYDIGRPTSGRPRDIYLGRNLYVNGEQVDFSNITLGKTGIISGAAKTSGYPLILQPGGAGHDYCTVSATATDMVGNIDGTAFVLEQDRNSSDLGLAPSSQNKCYVSDSLITSDPDWSKTIGEYGGYISVTSVGMNIQADSGKIETFKITNGTSTELFTGYINNTSGYIQPIRRGICGTERIAFSYGDTITAMQQHFIFMDNDLETIDQTANYPTYSSSDPSVYGSVPASGDYWFDTANGVWMRYSGAVYEQLGRIYIGMAVCDETDCLWTEPTDFSLEWNSLISAVRMSAYNTSISFNNFYFAGERQASYVFEVSVAGETLKINDLNLSNCLVTYIEDGYSAASNIWYYLYITKTGDFKLSPIAPRRKDQRRGWYHPREYWRCVSAVYNAATFPSQNMNPGTGNATINYNECQVTHTLAYGGNSPTALCIPPMAEEAGISFIQSSASSLVTLFVRDGGDVTHIFKINSQYVPEFMELRQIENSRIKMQQNGGAYTIITYPTSYRIEW
jgi:hypothetical protein